MTNKGPKITANLIWWFCHWVTEWGIYASSGQACKQPANPPPQKATKPKILTVIIVGNYLVLKLYPQHVQLNSH